VPETRPGRLTWHFACRSERLGALARVLRRDRWSIFLGVHHDRLKRPVRAAGDNNSQSALACTEFSCAIKERLPHRRDLTSVDSRRETSASVVFRASNPRQPTSTHVVT